MSTTTLSASLVAALGELSNVAKNATNPHFKNRYASLDAILDSVRPVLQKHGLAVSQEPITGEGMVGVVTKIIHTSGESTASTLLLPAVQNTAQGYGSAITYARRYAISSILGIAADDDDDGQSASTPSSKPAAKATPAPKQEKAEASVKTEADVRSLEELFHLMDKDKINESLIFDFLKRKGADVKGAQSVFELPPALVERLVAVWGDITGEGK